MKQMLIKIKWRTSTGKHCELRLFRLIHPSLISNATKRDILLDKTNALAMVFSPNRLLIKSSIKDMCDIKQ